MIVDDQEKALRFYTAVLGFIKKNDMPAGRLGLIESACQHIKVTMQSLAIKRRTLWVSLTLNGG